MNGAELFNIGGVIPQLAVKAGIKTVRSETGIGALMPWAGRLWFITYVAHTASSGSGTGLFSIDGSLKLEKHPESVVGTYANRILHSPTNQVIIGPHIIDVDGNVRTFRSLAEHRLAATMEHLYDPEHMVYFLTMEGLFFEANVHTLGASLIADLVDELKLTQNAKPHFKAGWSRGGRVVVANNTYDEQEFLGEKADGRLAEWSGGEWTILERNPFNEIFSIMKEGAPIFATGWDRASAILKVFVGGSWSTYRLPKGTHAMDHMILTEWPRIREVETERFLMDCHGIFYEMPHLAYQDRLWGIRPISTHLRMIPDFCTWQGLLVLAGNQVTPIWDSNLLAGEPQSNLWFGKTDDLWQFGKPKGWGGPWCDTKVRAHQPSEPFLMTGFDQKVLHLCQTSERDVEFTVQIDFLGNGTWKQYDRFRVPNDGYIHHEFSPGFSAHWVRIIPDADCRATAHFMYT